MKPEFRFFMHRSGIGRLLAAEMGLAGEASPGKRLAAQVPWRRLTRDTTAVSRGAWRPKGCVMCSCPSRAPGVMRFGFGLWKVFIWLALDLISSFFRFSLPLPPPPFCCCCCSVLPCFVLLQLSFYTDQRYFPFSGFHVFPLPLRIKS